MDLHVYSAFVVLLTTLSDLDYNTFTHRFIQHFMQYTFKYFISTQPFKITSALNSLWVHRIIEPAQSTQNIPSTATPEHSQYPGALWFVHFSLKCFSSQLLWWRLKVCVCKDSCTPALHVFSFWVWCSGKAGIADRSCRAEREQWALWQKTRGAAFFHKYFMYKIMLQVYSTYVTLE